MTYLPMLLLSLYSLACGPHMVASSSTNGHHYVAWEGRSLCSRADSRPHRPDWARAATSPWTSLPRSSSELDTALLSMGGARRGQLRTASRRLARGELAWSDRGSLQRDGEATHRRVCAAQHRQQAARLPDGVRVRSASAVSS
jgi:hypothetical protein